MAEIHEECGVFGVYGSQNADLAGLAYYGLYALQHRGQESCGIVLNDDGVFSSHRDLGTVNDVFSREVLGRFPQGTMAIGHVRYGTTGGNNRENCQPIVVNLCTEGIGHCKTLFLSGALTDSFLTNIRGKRMFANTEIVVSDFTKIFVSPLVFRSFVNGGGTIRVMQKSNLLAVTVNPTAPNGIVLDSERLCSTLSEAIGLPVYDLMKN